VLQNKLVVPSYPTLQKVSNKLTLFLIRTIERVTTFRRQLPPFSRRRNDKNSDAVALTVIVGLQPNEA
jgi:hypothetical protein